METYQNIQFLRSSGAGSLRKKTIVNEYFTKNKKLTKKKYTYQNLHVQKIVQKSTEFPASKV